MPKQTGAERPTLSVFLQNTCRPSLLQKYCWSLCSRRTFGALENDNLEHFDPCALIEELEEWELYLRSDPEVILRLRALDRGAQDDGEDQIKLNTSKSSILRGPKP